jgi:hypothetical protein
MPHSPFFRLIHDNDAKIAKGNNGSVIFLLLVIKQSPLISRISADNIIVKQPRTEIGISLS